jgi:hypothetical protein
MARVYFSRENLLRGTLVAVLFLVYELERANGVGLVCDFLGSFL